MSGPSNKPFWLTVITVVGVQIAVITVEAVLHYALPSSIVALTLILSLIAVVLMPLWLPRISGPARLQIENPWKRRAVNVTLVAIGFTFWSIGSSLLMWRKTLTFPEGVFRDPEGFTMLEVASGEPVHTSPFNRIAIVGKPQVGTDASGVHVLLPFRWDISDRGPMALFGNRTYDGTVYLHAHQRRTQANAVVNDPFQLVDYSAHPTRGNWSYVVGWADVWRIMQEADFLTNWVSANLPQRSAR